MTVNKLSKPVRGTESFSIIQQVLSDSHRSPQTPSTVLTGGLLVGDAAHCKMHYHISNSFQRGFNDLLITTAATKGELNVGPFLCMQ